MASLLSFVVPVHNEVDGLEGLVVALRRSGDALVASGRISAWEAVLVDDGSVDGSTEVLRTLALTDPQFVVRHHATNLGLGAALRRAFDVSRGEVVVYTDADQPFDLAEVGRVIDPILEDRTDFVSARRIGRCREGRWRGVQSGLYNVLVRTLFGLPVRDVNFACKAVHRCAVPVDLGSDSGFIDVEWLVWAWRRGLRIEQVAVEFLPRELGVSTLGGLRSIAALLHDLVRAQGRLRRPVRPVRSADG